MFANKRTFEMVHYSAEELFGRPFSDFVHPDDREMVVNRYLARVRGEIVEPVYTFRLIDRDGSILWLELRATPIEWEGRPASLHFATDITTRKMAEEALEQVNREQAAIIDFLPDATFAIDNDRKVVFWNRALEEMSGVKASNMIGKGDYAYTVPFYGEARPLLMDLIWEDSSNTRSKYPTIVKEGNAFVTEVYCPALYGGKGAWVFAKASPLHDRDGNVVGAIETVRDITERKRAEEDLKKSEEQYRLLAENTEDVIWTMDTDLHFTYFSPSVRKLLGLEVEEAMRQTIQEQLTPESLQAAMRELEANREDIQLGIDKSVSIEIEDYRKDGTTVWVEAIVRALYDDRRKHVGFIGISRDISERKLADDALRRSRSRYYNLVENADEAVFILQDGLVKFTNARAEKLTGCTWQEMLSQHFAQYLHQDDVERLADYYSLKIDLDTLPPEEREFRIIGKDGQINWVEAKTLVTEWEGSEATLYFLRDISASRKSAEALKRAEERFREFFENATNYCYVVSPEGQILNINKSAMNVLGYGSKDEIIGKSLLTTVYAPGCRDKAGDLFAKWKETGKLEDEELVIIDKNGMERDVILSMGAIRDDSGNLLYSISIHTDITEHKRLLAEQERLNKLESVGTLAGGIAHDFNNILGAIVGNISLAKAEVSSSQDVFALLTDAEKAVMRAKDLTRRLLTFAQGGTPVKKQSQLREMIRDTANFATAGTAVKCRFSIAADLWPCEIDEGQISQVVHNLVLNARQAMPSGGWIDIAAENIALSEEQRLGKSLPLSNGDYVRIIIEDHGIGIPLQYINKIFDPYFTTKQQGSGLGLASCLSIMREHKGHISVDSKPGEGTTFYVYLPATPGATIPGSQIEDKEIIRLTGKILVMDDEPALRETIKSMLIRMGFERVDTAGNGEEALKLYQEAMDIKEPFDAVILDLTVPGGMGGSETLAKLLEINPGVVAVVSSGYATEPVMADFGKYGFKGVIIKPYTFDDLFKTMHSIMGSR